MSAVPIARLDTAAPDFEARFAKLRHWSDEADAAIEQAVTALMTRPLRAEDD